MARQKVCPRAVILTALPVEYCAIRQHVHACKEATHKGTFYEHGVFSAQACRWNVAIVQTGVGNALAAAQTERAIEHFRPDVALFVGVAGGVKDVAYGDVVAATKAFCYASGKAANTFLPRPEVGLATFRMVQRAAAVKRSNDWWLRIPGSVPEVKPCVHVAPIAAGEHVVSSVRSATSRFLRRQYSQVVAVEMEGFGFLQAIQANQNIEALVIRGISDLLDHKAEADAAASQERASRHAGAFAFEILAGLATDSEFMARVANAHASGHSGKRGPEPAASKYSIQNSGPMVAGDHAQMINHWYRASEQ
ncbi:MAG TPA: 5'-methylthioadenosine/S-adenosylhomocysteine nucleosidase [Ktedonobacteraceae bacterium]